MIAIPSNPNPEASVACAPSPAGRPVRLPELLAPAGDWDCARAAVENGADAIYFGLEKFNARMRANNFTEADLPRLMEYLHRRGVRGYVTFNILVFENELAEAEHYARSIIAAGVDAAIVQDVGLTRLLRRLSPDFPVHVSTQMTITSAAGLEFARELGCDLVVLARECSLKEIAQIQETQQAAARDHGLRELPLEVFVHGALCVAYSGQCLTSEALGGRSANRGECAQACRMPYDLLCDDQPVALGDRKYLLSPQDLASIDLLPELARLGVASLKIEGRLKSAEYVANITRVYRSALEQIGANAAKPEAPAGITASAQARYDLEMAFSRGLHTGWFHGVNNQQLVHARFGKKRGVYLGEVAEVRRDAVALQLEADLKPGDGVVFDAGRPEEKEEGGRVYEIRDLTAKTGHSRPEHRAPPPADAKGVVLLFFGRGDVDFLRIHPGDKVWKTSDPELEGRLRQTFEGGTPRFQRPLHCEVHGVVGRPLTLITRDDIGHVVQIDSAIALARAEKQPLTPERLQEQLGRLGGTPFRLGSLRVALPGPVMLPVSELNRLRRETVSRMEALRAAPKRWTLNPEAESTQAGGGRPKPGLATGEQVRTSVSAELVVLVRNMAQLETILDAGISRVHCDFEDPKRYRAAVDLVRSARPAEGRPAPEIFVAPARIYKMGEEWTLKQIRSSNADGYLARNYDHLSFFAGERLIGDYSLNVANSWTAEYFKTRFGLEFLTPSYDLNFTQLEALLKATPPDWFEITLHQHMPMFHMEHCVFCAFLTTGTDYTNCGRPCDKYDLKLRDRVGAEHPVKADVGCRNTVFNALAQTGAEYAGHMQALGARRFRLEFLNESPEVIRKTVTRYRRLLRGEITGAHLWRELRLFNQLGVTRGTIGQR